MPASVVKARLSAPLNPELAKTEPTPPGVNLSMVLLIGYVT